MASKCKWAAIGLMGLAAACGGGGGGSAGFSGGTAESNFGVVSLLGHSPAADAVQVAVDAVLVLEFDATMALETFADEDTWLRADGSDTDVPGSFARGSGGRVSFRPTSPLAPETDYTFQLSPLTSDQNGRILDRTVTFTFRTFDATPPSLLAVDVVAGSSGQSRTRTFTWTFDERINAAAVTATSCYLRDVFNVRYPAELRVDGNTVTLDPYADLPGNRYFTLVLGTQVADRAGNTLAQASLTSFTTQADVAQPSVTAVWPANGSTGRSPLLQPTITFDESMDPATVEASSLSFVDQYGGVVAFGIDATPDQRSLRLVPTTTLAANRAYSLSFLLGDAAATDVSGNSLTATQTLNFTTGSDVVAPTLAASSPGDGESRVPGTATLTATFDEALDAAFVDTDSVTLTVAGEPWAAVVELTGGNTVRVTPVLSLPVSSLCVLTLRSGQDGLHDVAGNVLAADRTITFTTSGDAGQPRALLFPPDGAVGVAPGGHASVVFDAAMDASTLGGDTLQLCDDLWNPLPGAWTLSADNRVATFQPTTPTAPLAYYRLRVRGGDQGARRVSGNWLSGDQTSRFRTGNSADVVPPTLTATINGISASRASGLNVPPSGFTIDVSAYDYGNQLCDMGSIEILLQGNGSAPGAEALLAAATIAYDGLQVRVPGNQPLTAGSWTLLVRGRDIAGNLGSAATLTFTVSDLAGAALPFPRTQIVWVRTDLDRDGNGRADFDDDLLRLGLASEGDPAGTNTWLRKVLLDAMLAQANRMYWRGDRGEPLDTDSVMVRFSTRQPIALAHTQMALGGYDPEGSRTRVYGDESTGVLGRAYYDYRNGNPAERNTATSPGLGVFPGEMWLYQTRIHQQVYPSYLTQFAQRFKPLCAAMGGTPAGSAAGDAQVLRADFDYAAANSTQRARWQTVMSACDDWAAVIGIILAHETGHSIGLVAPGAMPSGLFGDSSLHDSYADAAEVMAPSVGYEAMTTLDYGFRDLDLAYLRQRVILK